ncbi:MAG: hypothetical protein U0931_35585 [Vulcanimicrobiota bacterium]
MASYLIIASDLPALEGRPMKANDVLELMRHHGCWEFSERSSQAKLRAGDRVFFYLGSKVQAIVGEAEVQGPAIAIDKGSPETFDRNRFPFFRWRMPMKQFEFYPIRGANLDLLMELSFPRNSPVTRPDIGLLLRVGMRTLTEEDVNLIRSRAGFLAKA